MPCQADLQRRAGAPTVEIEDAPVDAAAVGMMMARPARLELTTFWSATRCSIH
jgi:hypothetical protein